MAEEQSLLVKECVLYSITKDESGTGVVMDKITMKQKPTDTEPVTGYMVRDDKSRKLIPLAYWRILETISTEDVRRPKKQQR